MFASSGGKRQMNHKTTIGPFYVWHDVAGGMLWKMWFYGQHGGGFFNHKINSYYHFVTYGRRSRRDDDCIKFGGKTQNENNLVSVGRSSNALR